MICVYRSPSLWLGLICFCVLTACDKAKTKPFATTANTATTPAKATYKAELEKLNAGIKHGIALSAKQAGDTLLPLQVVALYQERARLTGNYEDYATAESLLARQPAVTRPSAALCLARARLHYTLHRLKQASVALD